MIDIFHLVIAIFLTALLAVGAVYILVVIREIWTKLRLWTKIAILGMYFIAVVLLFSLLLVTTS